MDGAPQSKPRGVIFFPENREFLKKTRSKPSWTVAPLWFYVIMVLTLAFSLFIFFIYNLPEMREWWKLRDNTVIVSGRVLSAETTVARHPSLRVEYEYAYNSQRYTHTDDLNTDNFDAIVAQKDTIRVRLAPDDPGVARLEDFGDSEGTVLIILTVVLVIWIVFLLVVLIAVVNEVFLNRRLAKNGKLVRGEILSYEVKQLANQKGTADHVARAAGGLAGTAMLNGARRLKGDQQPSARVKRQGKVRYQFTSPTSGKVIEKTETITRDDGDLPLEAGPGTQVAVYYRADHHFKLL